MTNMRRVTISLPEDFDRRILELRKDDEFIRCSYSEIVRKILERGMADVFNKSPSEDVEEARVCS